MKCYLSSILCILIFVSACDNQYSSQEEEHLTQTFWVGTYNSDSIKGIFSFELYANGDMQLLKHAAITDNPSYLSKTPDNRYLLCTNEVDQKGNASIESYGIIEDSLEFISRSLSGGAHPCYITVNKNAYVLTANYSGGNIALHQINEKGVLSDLLDIQQHQGSGVHTRQEGPHAHAARFVADQNLIISVDLGTNSLWFSTLDADNHKFQSHLPQQLFMDTAAGPRHLAFHPNGQWLYVINELSSTITWLYSNPATTYTMGHSISTLPAGYEGANHCADIHISSDGRFLYASNRGHNSIAIYSIDLKTGQLKLLDHQSVYGDWPRNFSLSPDENFLLVANKKSNNMVCFHRDTDTGLLQYASEIEAPSPVCILF